MVHSNNAARVRLWMNIKQPLTNNEPAIETRMISYADLKTPEFARSIL